MDHDAYAALVDRHINEGGHGILVNGTTAEPSTLSVRERNEIVDTAISVARGRTQIVVASGSQSHAETIELSDHASRAGAQALLIVTPYYIKPPQRGLVRYYLDMAERSDLPIMIYHIPGRAAVDMKKESVFEIAEKADNFVGIKHASTDLGFVSDCLQELGREFRIFVGLEELSFPMLAMGASGLMNAVGNLFPKQVAELYEAAVSGDLEKGRQLHYDMLELNRAVFFDTNPIPMKYMAKRLGILQNNEHRLPMCPATPELEKRLDKVLADAGLLQGETTIFYDPRDNLRPEPLSHNPVNALVAPRPIGWISTMDKLGRVNLAPFSYFNALSADPPMVIFGPNAKNDLEDKDSYRNVLEVPEFVVNIVSAELKDQMIATSEPVNHGVNEMELAGLTPADSINVRPPRVAEARAALECVVFKSGDLPGGHDGRIGHFVIGQVVGIHIDDDVIRDGKVDETILGQISRLGYFNYNEIKEVFEMKRPG